MAEAAFGFVSRALGYILRDCFFYFTARLALPALTFGWWRVKPLTDRKSNLGWYGMKRQPDGTMMIGFDLAVLVGVATWVVVGLCLVAAVALT